jgi:hypothetical protein
MEMLIYKMLILINEKLKDKLNFHLENNSKNKLKEKKNEVMILNE